jgi:hypothetical protein
VGVDVVVLDPGRLTVEAGGDRFADRVASHDGVVA